MFEKNLLGIFLFFLKKKFLLDKFIPKKNEDLNKFTLFDEEDCSEICQDETDIPGKEIKKLSIQIHN